MCVHIVVPPGILRKSTTVTVPAGSVMEAGSKDGGTQTTWFKPWLGPSLTTTLASPLAFLRFSFLTCTMGIVLVVNSRAAVKDMEEKGVSGLAHCPAR